MSTLEMYLERAAQCRQEAANTTLANVRERCLRSALAWEGMVDQLRVTETTAQMKLLESRAAGRSSMDGRADSRGKSAISAALTGVASITSPLDRS